MYVHTKERHERERKRQKDREKPGDVGSKSQRVPPKRHTPASPRDTGYLASQFAKLKYENQSEQSGAIPSFEYFI